MTKMNVKTFINTLKKIEGLPTTYYSVSGGDWAKWNGKSWNFDCVILIKAILWGWNGNKKHAHGGAKYGSNGVYDDTTEQIIKRCKDVSTDFSKIEPGELLWMSGHVGIYVGNGQVIECTAAWEGGVLYSAVGTKGQRKRNGKQVLTWKKHGKLPYIDYTEEMPDTKHKVGETIYFNGIYVSSTSTDKLSPAKNHGKITSIVDARNPYLIEKGNIGWTNDECIIPEPKKEEPVEPENKPDTSVKPDDSTNTPDMVETSPETNENEFEDVIEQIDEKEKNKILVLICQIIDFFKKIFTK